MTKKSLGYVELEWECPHCNGRNPGPVKVCGNCGSPQPEDVKFTQKVQDDLITDEEKLAQAKAGPDIHCAYCGTRNPATATTCSQCHAELSEGTARQTGQTVGQHQPHASVADITCPYCGTQNPATATKCAQCAATLDKPTRPTPKPKPKTTRARPKKSTPMNPLIIGIAVVGVLLLCGLLSLLLRTEEVTGQVQSVNWERTVVIEQLGPATYETWQDEIPFGVPVGSCSDRVRRTQNSPTTNSREVCGEPYVVDNGTGFGEVVQDCQYEVYEAWCSYTVEEWQAFTELSAKGDDYSPYWPDTNLQSNQREGERAENFRIFFSDDGEVYTHSPNSYERFRQFEIGSSWQLEVNAFNGVTSAEPLP